MAGRTSKYVLAAALTAAVVGGSFGPFRCGLYGCAGGYSEQAFVWALIAGAMGGLAGMAVIDFVLNGRYALANRAEAKRRLQAEARHLSPRPQPPTSDGQ